MAESDIQALLDNIRLPGEQQHLLVESVRALVKDAISSISEEVKYGGILFSSSGVHFCGVFAYEQHVSVEFGSGVAIADPDGHLEGKGNKWRHIKLRTAKDIEDKNLVHYLPLALEAARHTASLD